MTEFPFRSLREWLNFLEEKGDLVKNREEVDLREEISAIAKKIIMTNNSPILHENVRGYPGWRIANSTFLGLHRKAWVLGVGRETILKEVSQKLDMRVSPIEVSTGPCKEIKIFGDEVDLTMLPIPFTGAFEGTPNITAGMSNIRDLDTGWQNIAVRRFGLKGKRTLSEFINPGNQDFAIWANYRRAKKKMPIAIIIGADPCAYLVSQTKQPPGVCEYDLWGAFTGEPLEVVKCETSDLLVPATAEIVLEGEVDPEARELDGPFPEFMGYYTTIASVAQVKINAITMRKNPIFYYLGMGWAPTEGHEIGSLMLSISTYRELSKVFPGILDVYCHGWLYMVIRVEKEIAKNWVGYAKQVANVAKNLCKHDLKICVVVDEDVEDPSDYYQVVNAILNKFQATKDLTIAHRTLGCLLDPSEPWSGSWGWTDFMIMDCTEKPSPWDEGYKRGKAIPSPKSMQRVEEKWDKYGFKR